MNSLLQTVRLPAANAPLQPGVPFTSRLFIGANLHRPTAVMGNRAFVRAWAAHRAANAMTVVQRAK